MTWRVLSRIVLCLLLVLGALLPALANDYPCMPVRGSAPPVAGEKLRPVPEPGATAWPGNNRQPVPGNGALPSAPFPPATQAPNVTRSSPANEPPVPAVAVRVRVPSEIAAGQELAYQITAENVSRADAHHVTVRVPMPSNAKYVRATPQPDESANAIMWKLGTLRGGEKRDIRLIVTASGEGEVNCCARVVFEHGQCVRTKLTRPGVQIKRSGPVEGAKNDLLKFKIEVRNEGKVTAKDVVITETLPAGLAFSTSQPATTGDNPLVWKLGDLEPGKSRIVEYDAIADGSGKLTPAAIVTASGGVKRESSYAVQIGEPALSVTQTGPKFRLPNRPAVYTFTIRNTGTFTAKNVDLEDELPDEIQFITANGGGRLENNLVRWSIGTLPPGASKTVQMTVKATMAGTLKNVCTVRAARDLWEQAKCYTRFTQVQGLSLEIDKPEEPVPTGKMTTWTLRILNEGTSNEKNAGAVVHFPEGLTLVNAQGAEVVPGENKVRMPPIATLAPRNERTFTVRLKAEKAGEYEVRAEAYSDGTGGPAGVVKVEETLTVGTPKTHTSQRADRRSRERTDFVR